MGDSNIQYNYIETDHLVLHILCHLEEFTDRQLDCLVLNMQAELQDRQVKNDATSN